MMVFPYPRIQQIALLLGAALMVLCGVACGDAARKDLRQQIEQLQAQQVSLQQDWKRTKEEMDLTLRSIQTFSKDTPLQEPDDLALLRLALLQCFSSPFPDPTTRETFPGLEALACEGEAISALIQQFSSMPEVQQEAIRQKLLTVSSVKVALRRGLPAQSRMLAQRYAQVRDQNAEIRLEADVTRAQQGSPSIFRRQQRADFDASYKELLQQLDATLTLLNQLEAQALDLPNVLHEVTVAFSKELVTLGDSPPPKALEQSPEP